MSVAASSWAVKQRAGGAGPKAVLLALAHHADAKGQCFPSQPLLAEELEIDERSVRRHVISLETRGLIQRVRRYRRNGSRTSDAYVLNINGDNEFSMTLPDNLSGDLPDTVSANLPENLTGSLPDNLSVLDTVSGYDAENGGPTGQKVQSLPDTVSAPTTFERSVEEEQITASSPPPPSLAHTHEEAGGGEREEAVAEMTTDLNVETGDLPDNDRRRLRAVAKPIIGGDDRTAWRDPRTGDEQQIDWSERPAIFRTALARVLGNGETGSGALSTAVRYCALRQLAPLPSNRPPAGSQAASITNEYPRNGGQRGSTFPTAPGAQQRKAASDAEADAWARAHPIEAQVIADSIDETVRLNKRYWDRISDDERTRQLREVFRGRVKERMRQEEEALR